MPVTTFEQSIQGKAAGVQVNQGTGKLAQGIQVRVRGQSSVSASNEPLYVLDGIPLTQGDLGINGGGTNPLVDINPQDIEVKSKSWKMLRLVLFTVPERQTALFWLQQNEVSQAKQR